MTTTPPPGLGEQLLAKLRDLRDQQTQLTAERNATIVEAARAGEFHRDIAAAVGLSRDQVGRIVTAANDARTPPVEPTEVDTESDG